jgi:hypothetical protein
MIGEVIPAVCSLAFYRVVRAGARALWVLYARRRSRKGVRWQFADAETLNNPLALPILMTTGPRWNTHALIANLGPVPVRETLELDVAPAERSAKSWTVVVSAFPAFRSVATVSSLAGPFPEGIARVPLPAGTYSLGLRYYHWADTVELPGVRVDGQPVTAGQWMPPDLNRYLHDLPKRTNLFYRALHYYVYVALKYADRLPAGFAEQEFLPVGNPETRFRYGIVPRGKSLRVETSPALRNACDVYVTLYNRASFPVHWFEVTGDSSVTPAFEFDCMYLIRLHPRHPAPAGAVMPEVTLIDGTPA